MQWAILRASARLARFAPASLKDVRRWGVLADWGFRVFSPFEPYTEVETVFVSDRETAVLARAGIQKPKPLDYLRRIADYAVRVDFGAGLPLEATTQQRAEAS